MRKLNKDADVQLGTCPPDIQEVISSNLQMVK